MCRVCGERWQEGGYCKRCREVVDKVREERQSVYQADCEEVARTYIFPPVLSDSELFATRVDLDWHFTEIADAIRKRAGLWVRGGTILLRLSGVGRLTGAQLEYLGEDLGAVVRHGTEPDTLYIVGL